MKTNPLIIAGPCSAESLSQIMEVATDLAAMGITIFRAGIWKPRTKPGGFEGVGEVGLEWLAQVKRDTGMAVATEVANSRHVELALKAGIDILWIGARTTTNPFAVQEIAEALRGSKIPVMVKNPVNPDPDLWMGAFERLAGSNITDISAIHRGFSSYIRGGYRNPPQWHIPIELRRRAPEIPIICDPSHIGGSAELIAPLSNQAMEIGMDGLMIECHPRPQEAKSDAAQQITPAQLRTILSSLNVRGEALQSLTIESLRREIDDLDTGLLEIISKRMNISKTIGEIKRDNNIPVLQPDRYDSIIKSRMAKAVEFDLDSQFVMALLEHIHEESVKLQLSVNKKPNKL